MQAVILVGGEGTRLRPLTTGTPKPIVTFVDRPFMAFMLEWLRRHGVDDVIMSCGFLATKVRDVLGDGSHYGLRLRFVEEPEPRGTAGALKYAEDLLEDRFLMLNGDVLTDVDVSAQLARHTAAGAVGTLGLVPVDDPSAYGLVLCDAAGAVTGFLEKPGPDDLVGVQRYLISAGIYVLERAVLDLIPPDRNVSIEREIWPRLVGEGLYGHAADGAYWLDIGTPERYLDGTADILLGNVATAVTPRVDGVVEDGAVVHGPVVVEPGARVARGARVAGPAVIGHDVVLEAGSVVERAVVLRGGHVRREAHVRGAILAPGVTVGERSVVEDLAVVGEGVTVGADNLLARGIKLSPGTSVPDGAIKF